MLEQSTLLTVRALKSHVHYYLPDKAYISIFWAKKFVNMYIISDIILNETYLCFHLSIHSNNTWKLSNSFFFQNKRLHFNPLSTNFTKWSNTLKQFVGKLPTNCLGVFDHFVESALRGLRMFPELWIFLCCGNTSHGSKQARSPKENFLSVWRLAEVLLSLKVAWITFTSLIQVQRVCFMMPFVLAISPDVPCSSCWRILHFSTILLQFSFRFPWTDWAILTTLAEQLFSVSFLNSCKRFEYFNYKRSIFQAIKQSPI